VHPRVEFETRTRIHRVWNPWVPASTGPIAIPSRVRRSVVAIPNNCP
jgi:hypothetical protein